MFSKASSSDPTIVPQKPKTMGGTTPKTMPSIISAGLHVTGDLVSDGDLQVEGTIEGNVKSRLLTVGESGSVDGEITADQVTVAGSVTGKIKARNVSLTQSARVTGDIAHDSLSIDAGARFEGSCTRLGGGDKVGVLPTTGATTSRVPGSDIKKTATVQ